MRTHQPGRVLTFCAETFHVVEGWLSHTRRPVRVLPYLQRQRQSSVRTSVHVLWDGHMRFIQIDERFYAARAHRAYVTDAFSVGTPEEASTVYVVHGSWVVS
jgi:hypothetical protein